MLFSKSKVTPWYSLFLLTSGHFLSDFYANFLPALLPLVISKLGLSLTLSGLLVMVFSITSSMLQPICGYFVDKSGYTWLLLITLPFSAAFICFSPLAPNTVILFSAIALSGIATSLFHPLGSSLVGKASLNEQQSLAMSLFIGGGNLGYAIAPAIIIFFLLHYGLETLPILIIPSILLTVALYSNGLHKIPLAVVPRTTTQIRRWYHSVSLLKLNAVMALRSWPQVAIPTFLPVMLHSQGHSPVLAGQMLTVFLLSGAVGGLLGGYCGDKIGYKKCILGALLLSLLPTYFFLGATKITWFSWIMLGLCGALLQSMVPSSIVWAQAILPENAAMASGMMLGLTFGLGGVGTAITGTMADYVGLQPALLWTVVPLLLAIVLALNIPNTQMQSESGLKTPQA